MAKINWKFLYILYLLLLPVGALTINRILKQESIKVDSLQEDKKVDKIKEVIITISVESGKYKGNYNLKMTNNDSIESAIEELRRQKLIYYELETYADRTDILMDGEQTEDQSRWGIFLDNKEITNLIHEYNLEDDKTYIVKRVEK